MPLVELKRFAYTPVGTFGRLHLPAFSCFTVECPWMDNIPNTSCIPEGRYEMALGYYNRGGYGAYEILQVPQRTHIKIHRGNNVSNIRGCVATGRRLGSVGAQWSVTDSRPTFAQFMQAMGGVQHATVQITFERLAALSTAVEPQLG